MLFEIKTARHDFFDKFNTTLLKYISKVPFLKIFLFIVTLNLCSYNCHSQVSFEKTFGSPKNEDGFCVHQTADKGYIISGIIEIDSVNTDIYLIKTDSLGDTLWTKSYGGPKGEFQNVVQQTNDGGYVIVGSTYSYGAGQGDIFLLKTNSNGDTSWTKTYGGIGDEIGQYIQQTNDGGYIIGGHSDTFGPRGDFYLIKTNATGDTIWTRNYGGTKHDHGFCVQQTIDSGYIIVGHSLSFGLSGGFYAVKTTNTGDTLWTRGYGGATNSYCYFVQQTTDGGYILTGSTDCFGAGNADALVIKTNSTGDTVWTKTYGGTGSDYFNCVKQTPDGGYILVGATSSFSADSSDVYLVKINSVGDTLWSKTFGGLRDDEGIYISLSLDSGYIIAGLTNSYGNGGMDFYLIKTDKNGNAGCNSTPVHTLITKPDSLMFNVPTTIGFPHTLVGTAPFLTSIDANSTINICSSIGIQYFEKENEVRIKAYPSPTDYLIFIEAEKTINLAKIYDCQGKLIYQQKSASTITQIDISNLQSGIYILEVLGKHIRIVKG